MKCEFCESQNTVKNGFVRGKQRYLCKACGKTFTLEDGRKNNVVSERIFDLMCCSENISVSNYIDSKNEFIGIFSKHFGVSKRTINRWIKRREYHTQLSGVLSQLGSIDYVSEEYLDRRKNFLCVCINLDDNANATIIVQRKS